MRKKILNTIAIVFGCFALACSILWASAVTTNTVSTGSYFGREAIVKKLTFTVTPVANDDNSIYTSVLSDDEIFGNIRRIAISTTGTDTSFSVILKDEDGIAIYTKADCTTASTPFSGFLASSSYDGIFTAGKLTLDVNNVDPNNLTGVTVKVYYADFRN